MPSLIRLSTSLWKILFVLGLLLLVVNTAGLFLSLRNGEIYTEPLVAFPDDIVLTYDEFQEQVKRRPGEPEVDYIYRLNGVVNKGMAHYWHAEGLERYNIRVPIWENYLLFAGSFLWPYAFGSYEFQDPDKSMERGVGWCSHQADLLNRLLIRERIPAQTLFLNEGKYVTVHAVVQVQTGGKWLVADPDYGVVMPFHISEIEADPTVVKPYYADISRTGWVARDQNYVPTGDLAVGLYSGADSQLVMPSEKRANFEKVVYILKWLLPAVLMLPLALTNGIRRYRLMKRPGRPTTPSEAERKVTVPSRPYE
jgi:hypothetical protein